MQIETFRGTNGKRLTTKLKRKRVERKTQMFEEKKLVAVIKFQWKSSQMGVLICLKSKSKEPPSIIEYL